MRFLEDILVRIKRNKFMFDQLMVILDLYLDSQYDLKWIMIDSSGELYFLNENKIDKTLRQQIDEVDEGLDLFLNSLFSQQYQAMLSGIGKTEVLEEQNYFKDIDPGNVSD